jgi:hypothetical protein
MLKGCPAQQLHPSRDQCEDARGGAAACPVAMQDGGIAGRGEEWAFDVGLERPELLL